MCYLLRLCVLKNPLIPAHYSAFSTLTFMPSTANDSDLFTTGTWNITPGIPILAPNKDLTFRHDIGIRITLFADQPFLPGGRFGPVYGNRFFYDKDRKPGHKEKPSRGRESRRPSRTVPVSQRAIVTRESWHSIPPTVSIPCETTLISAMNRIRAKKISSTPA